MATPLYRDAPMIKDTTGPCSRVELILSARNLADKDVFSKSDPICVVELLQPRDANHMEYVEIGRTERIKNNLNPQWNKKIYLNYFFETKQELRFRIYDIDSDSAQLTDHDYLGGCGCKLAEIVAAPEGSLSMPIQFRDAPNQKNGLLIARAEEVDDGQRENLYHVCHGRDLSRKSMFSRPDVFLEFYRLRQDGSRQMVHRTEVDKKTQNPEWRPFEVTVRHLCEGDKDREFLIECYEHDSSGSHKLIGSTRTSINGLVQHRKRHLPLIKHKKMGGDKQSGTLHFLEVQLRREYTFLDFVTSGMQLEFAVAVDFTQSNGPINSASSLHYVSDNYLNQYQMAIRAVLDICEHYNHTKAFEALGFGARIPPSFEVSHCFPLSGLDRVSLLDNLPNSERHVYGVSGVLEVYGRALANANIQLYGPTNFAPTIMEFVHKTSLFPRDGSRYQVLLIITDGIITDMQKTKAAIVAASEQPMSIIIIGVGNDEFESMDELDSDNKLISANGHTAKRDIVQFVPFRKFFPFYRGAGTLQSLEDQAHVQSVLAKEVLAELPNQVCSYMKANGISPAQIPKLSPGVAPPHPPPNATGFSQVPPPTALYPMAPNSTESECPYPNIADATIGVENIQLNTEQSRPQSSAPPL